MDEPKTLTPLAQEDADPLSSTTEETGADSRALVSPRPMHYADLPAVVRTNEAAFKEDPFIHWLRDTPDYKGGGLPAYAHLTETYTAWSFRVANGTAWTVDDGAAIVCYGAAKITRGRTEKAVEAVAGRLFSVASVFTNTPQQRKRGEEIRAKHTVAFKEALGDRELEVIHLQVLATHPDKQGHGYGSALVRTVTGIADAQGRATVLTSSNPINTGFYNSLRFVEKAQIVLGNDDPTWTDPPVVLLVMVREPASCP